MALMFKKLPAYELYCRNVEELHLNNIILFSVENETRPALTFDRVNNLDLMNVRASVKKGTTPMVHLRNTENVSAGFCRSLDESEALFELEEGTCSNIVLSNNALHPGQKEVVKVAALPDHTIFEDFPTAIKNVVTRGEPYKGMVSHDLATGPLPVRFDITKRGSLQLCLLILNETPRPEKVLLKYEGISQEFLIDWNEWGWAPITLLKEYEKDRQVDFEISAASPGSKIRVARVYMRYQDISHTD